MQKQHIVIAGLATAVTLGLVGYPRAQQVQGPAGSIVAVPEAPDGPVGTVGRIAKFTSATALGNSVIREAGGRIGIGLAPNHPFGGSLQIATAPGGNGLLQTNGPVALGTFAGNFFGGNSGGFGIATAHPLHFTIAGAPRMTIGTNGNVGIGTPAGDPLTGRLYVVNSGTAIRGEATGGSANGVIGTAAGNQAYGVWGSASGTNSRAGSFDGNVHVAGTLSKSAGSFRIDHPVEPARMYLSHSFVESPDMLNIYNGNAVLDADGRAEVTLPGYFEALNRDFRYTLTAIGAPGPNLHIAREIEGNRFAIAGGSAGQKVSWMVAGIRQDAYANAHRIPNEEPKPAHETGLYLHPELHGEPASKGVDYARMQRLQRPADTAAAPSSDHPRLAAARH